MLGLSGGVFDPLIGGHLDIGGFSRHPWRFHLSLFVVWQVGEFHGFRGCRRFRFRFNLGIFLGLPLLIVWIKDRGGVAGLVVRKIFGVISLLFGLTIIAWVIYNLFCPTEEFERSYYPILGLAVPIGMVGLGWHWLSGKAAEKNEESQSNVLENTGTNAPDSQH